MINVVWVLGPPLQISKEGKESKEMRFPWT